MNGMLAQRISSPRHLEHQIPKSGRLQRHSASGDGQKPFLRNFWRGCCGQEEGAAFFHMFWHFMQCLVKAHLQTEQQGCASAAEPAAGWGLLDAQQLPRVGLGPLGIGFVSPRAGTSPLDGDLFMPAPLGCWASLPRCIPGNLTKPGLPLPGLCCVPAGPPAHTQPMGTAAVPAPRTPLWLC